MRETERLARVGPVIGGPVVVDDALCAGNTVDGRVYQCAELVDQLELEERAVDAAATFEKQELRAEQSADAFHRAGEVVSFGTGEHLGHAVRAQFGKMGIRHLLTDDRDGVVAADIILAEMDAAGRIDADRQLAAFALAAAIFRRRYGFMYCAIIASIPASSKAPCRYPLALLEPRLDILAPATAAG